MMTWATLCRHQQSPTNPVKKGLSEKGSDPFIACSNEAPEEKLAEQVSIGEDALEKEFITPPQAAKPSVYWFFMDGNQDREQISKDIEAMARVGIGSLNIMEVNLEKRGQSPFPGREALGAMYLQQLVSGKI